MTLCGVGGPLSTSPSLNMETSLGNMGTGGSFDDKVALNLGLCLLDFGLDGGEAALADFAGDLPALPFFFAGMMNDCPCPGLRGFTWREQIRL